MSKRVPVADYFEKKTCRLCKSSNLVSVLDLGKTFLADEFSISDLSENEEYKFPLKLNFCTNCGWLQTSIVVNPVRLYQNDYPYDSSATETGRLHWNELANSLNLYNDWGVGKKSLDIGANVGVLVEAFDELGFEAIGVDPSLEACTIGINSGKKLLNNFFDLSFAAILNQQGFSFDVITATNVFAHIDDLDNWTLGVQQVLKDRGTLVIEVPHALSLITGLQFDTIYHEHLSYVSLKPLRLFFANFNLDINHVEERSIHGGTLRIYISKAGVFPIQSSVAEIIQKEEEVGIDSLHILDLFSQKIMGLIAEMNNFSKQIEANGQKLVVISAPAKGMTYLNVMGLKSPLVMGISDVTKQKSGRYAPGTGLVVTSDQELALLDADFALILAWNFADEIISKVRALFSKKTKFFVGIPSLKEI